MSRKYQILSACAFVSVLLLSIFFPKDSQQGSYDTQRSEYGNVIAIDLGEHSRAGIFQNAKFEPILQDDGRSFIPPCINDACILRPTFNDSIAVDIIKQLKTSAENYLGQNVTHTIIGVPPYFNDTQRQAVKDTAAVVGLNVLRIVNEPTAACIALGLDKTEYEASFFVYHLNSHSSDLSIINVDRGVFEIMAQVTESFGSKHLEQAVLEHIMATDTMRSQVSSAEEQPLSNRKSAKIQHSLTHLELDSVYERVFENLAEPLIKRVLKEAHMQKHEFDGIVLTGVPQQVAKIQSLLEQRFNKKVYTGIPTDEVIIRGLARQAAVLSDMDDEPGCFIDVTTLSLGIDSKGFFKNILPKWTVIPNRKSITVTTVEDNQPMIKFDVLQGARPFTFTSHKLRTLEFNVRKAKYGVPRIEIQFEVDANGVLTVMVGEKGRSWDKKVTIGDILYNHKLEVIETMLREADENHDADKYGMETFEGTLPGPVEGGFKILEEAKTVFMAPPTWKSTIAEFMIERFRFVIPPWLEREVIEVDS